VYHSRMGEETQPPLEPRAKPVRVQNPARIAATLVVGLLLGASLGPALFLAVDRIELKGDVLLSFAIGAFLTLGTCLVVAAVAALLILPRVFANARGTLAGVVDDLTQASRAHAQGDTDKALDHMGQAISEGVAWYTVGATRRFAVQAALGLLISFGGSIGAVLLFNQNALLRDQNKKIDEQVKLLTQQNDIADAQKRGAFVTEMFSILQEVAKFDRKGELPKELVSRIIVLTTSAVPYRYQSRAQVGKDPTNVVLSPERGQLLLALARMKVNLSSLMVAGTQFDYSDLRALDLEGIDLSETKCRSCDFSFSSMSEARLVRADLWGSSFEKTNLNKANFDGATLAAIFFKECSLIFTNFNNAFFLSSGFYKGQMSNASFEGALYKEGLEFDDVIIRRFGASLPEGLRWPSKILKAFEQAPLGSEFKLSCDLPDCATK
jgi:hypothetical protein